jgi:hypothetical protein
LVLLVYRLQLIAVRALVYVRRMRDRIRGPTPVLAPNFGERGYLIEAVIEHAGIGQ